METEAAAQLNFGHFESSKENIDQFASNGNSQNSFFGTRLGNSDFVRNFFRADQLWKIIIALAIFVFVFFASIAMIMHFASKVPPAHTSSSQLGNPHSSASASFPLKLQEKSVSESVSTSPPAPAITEKLSESALVSSITATSTSTPSLPTALVEQAKSTNAEGKKGKRSLCDPGWTPYKDESCFKLLPKPLKTFDEALESCKRAGGASLLVIRSAEKQAFFAEWIFKEHKAFDDVWIGARYNNLSGTFSWVVDDEPVADYSDWVNESSQPDSSALQVHSTRSLLWFGLQHRQSLENNNVDIEQAHTEQNNKKTLEVVQKVTTPARNYTEKECLHLTAYEAKWDATPCIKGNLVICEKLQSWSFQHLQRLFLQTRKTVAEQRLIMPVGSFVYAQFTRKQPEPSVIWPQMKWLKFNELWFGNDHNNPQQIFFWKRIA